MKTGSSKSLILILSLLLLLSVELSADVLAVRMLNGRGYISFGDLCDRFDFQKTFDSVAQKGKIYHGTHYAVFSVNHSLFIVDGEIIRTDYEVVRHEGEVLLPAEGVASVLRKFYAEAAISLNDSSLDYNLEGGGGITKKKKDKTDDKEKLVQEDVIDFIIIDPGHGGKDPGAIGKKNIQEKKITLSISKMLFSAMKKKYKNLRIIMTRDKDIFIPLAKRTDVANTHLKKKKNGLFLSIHVNASLSDKITGYETYFLSVNPTNEEARNTAALENDVVILEQKNGSTKGYGDVDYIEAMMLTTQIQKESSMLAECIQNGMDEKIKTNKSRGVKKADFFVLRGVLMPAALVEIGYITNRKEASALLKIEYQQQVAGGIMKGIVIFIERYNRMMTGK